MQFVTVATAVAATAAISASKIAQSATEKPGQVGIIVSDVRDQKDGSKAGVVASLKDIKGNALFIVGKDHKKAKATLKAIKKRHSVGMKFPIKYAEDLKEMSDEQISRKMAKLRKEIKKKHHIKVKYVTVPAIKDGDLAMKVGKLAADMGLVAITSDSYLHKSGKRAKKALRKLLKKPAEKGLLLRVSNKDKHVDDVLKQLEASIASFKKHAKHRHSRVNRKYFKLVKFVKAVKPLKGSKSESESEVKKSKSEDEDTLADVPMTREATRVTVRKHKKYVGKDAKKLVKKTEAMPVTETAVPPKSLSEQKPAEVAATNTNAGVRAGATMGSLLVAVVVGVFAML